MREHVDRDGVRIFRSRTLGGTLLRLFVGAGVAFAAALIAYPELLGGTMSAKEADAPREEASEVPSQRADVQAERSAQPGLPPQIAQGNAPASGDVARKRKVPLRSEDWSLPSSETVGELLERGLAALDLEPRERRAVERAIARGDLTLPAAGEAPSGMALFPRPGTQPLQSGFVVPENADLPAGYGRHYQVTDDGEALPPILTRSPDLARGTAPGEPLAPPTEIVIDPKDVPPGMPRELLEVPEQTSLLDRAP